MSTTDQISSLILYLLIHSKSFMCANLTSRDFDIIRQGLSWLKTALSQLQYTHSRKQKTSFTCSRQLIWNVWSKSWYCALIALTKWGRFTIIIILCSCYDGYLCNINDILSKQAVWIRECWSIKTGQIFMHVITYYCKVVFFHGSGSAIDLLKDAFFNGMFAMEFYPCRDYMHSQLSV